LGENCNPSADSRERENMPKKKKDICTPGKKGGDCRHIRCRTRKKRSTIKRWIEKGEGVGEEKKVLLDPRRA